MAVFPSTANSRSVGESLPCLEGLDQWSVCSLLTGDALGCTVVSGFRRTEYGSSKTLNNIHCQFRVGQRLRARVPSIHMVRSCLQLQLQGIQHPLLTSVDTTHTHVEHIHTHRLHTHTKSKTIQDNSFSFSVVYIVTDNTGTDRASETF